MIDYGADRPGDWLLIGSGCGIMMAVMDVELRFRYCFDIDSIKEPTARLDQWLMAVETIVSRIAVVGWFSITDPAPLRTALNCLKCRPLVYAGMGACELFPNHCTVATLDQFISTLGAL